MGPLCLARPRLVPALTLLTLLVPACGFAMGRLGGPKPVLSVFCLTETLCENSADNCRSGGYSLRFTKFDDLSGVMRFDNGPDMQARATTIAGQTRSDFTDREGTWEFTHDLDQSFTLMRRAPNAKPAYETYYAGTCEDQQ